MSWHYLITLLASRSVLRRRLRTLRRDARHRALLACAVVLSLASNAHAGLGGTLLICDSSDDRVARFDDGDGDGIWRPETADRFTVFYDASSEGPDLSVPAHLLYVESLRTLLLLDGGRLDAVLALRDGNDDLDANDGGEWSVFFERGPLATPNAMAAARDGRIYVGDNGAAARIILELLDINGDGDALDDGESTIVYRGSPDDATGLSDIESLAVAEDGTLFAGDTDLSAVFRLLDLDDDGLFESEGEVQLFYQGPRDPGLDLDALVALSSREVLAADENSGRVFRLHDVDGDGQAVGDGEVFLYVDPELVPGLADLNDMIQVGERQFVLLDGSSDTAFLAHDMNADGDALDPGEVVRLIEDNGENLSTPSGVAWIPGEVVAPEGFVRGDADDDGALTVSDAIRALEHLFSGGEIVGCLDAADADDSGVIDITDPVHILNHIFRGGSAPPPPFPERGRDPTPDALCEGTL